MDAALPLLIAVVLFPLAFVWRPNPRRPLARIALAAVIALFLAYGLRAPSHRPVSLLFAVVAAGLLVRTAGKPERA